MQRYGSGMRGSSVIPDSADVTVNYNGSTVDMGGSSYVNQGDVSGIVSQAVNATLDNCVAVAGHGLVLASNDETAIAVSAQVL